METLEAKVIVKQVWTLQHIRDGKILYEEIKENLIPTVGLNNILTQYYKGSAYTAAWYAGITGATPSPAAGDTMASHGGWTEVTNYDEANRLTLTFGTVSAGSVAASAVDFTISATVTVGGAFMVDNNTKGGSTGTLSGVVAFSGGNRSCVDNDIIRLTVTCTMASA